MKLTYKVRRNNEGKIIEKYFAIENFTDQEKQRILQVFANNGGGRLLDTHDYKAMIIAYDKNMESLAAFKDRIKELYNMAKTLQVITVKPADKKQIYTPKNTKKRKQRRIIQINKALDLLGEKCTLYTAIHCLSYVQEKRHRNGYFMEYVA